MFAYLKGFLQEKEGLHVVVNVHDVGYLVLMPLSHSEQLVVGGECSVHIITVVREDQITLYGFLTAQDKRWFTLLMDVQGIGGKMALAILSSLTVQQIREAICSKDHAVLKTISGLGPRIAERLVRELHSKVMKMEPLLDTGANTPDANQAKAIYDALLGLGYKKQEVEKISTRVLLENPDISVEQAILDILRELGRRA